MVTISREFNRKVCEIALQARSSENEMETVSTGDIGHAYELRVRPMLNLIDDLRKIGIQNKV